MNHQMASEKRQWPTLEGRLIQPLISRVEAVRQLQTTMPITSVAQRVLTRSNGASSNGPKITNVAIRMNLPSENPINPHFP
jgi:hypothetical protein